MASPEPDIPNSLGAHFRNAWRKAKANRPPSFYLLLAIPVVMVLGSRIAFVRDEPKRFALFLLLLFLFFFFVLARAIVDFVEITRKHFAEREELFRTTLGEEEFVKQLGERVAEQREE